MAHLLLRGPTDAVNPDTGVSNHVGAASLVDLSFLGLVDSKGNVSPHSIYQGHMSVVICGWSDSQWTGYTFTNTDNDDIDDEELDEMRGHFLTTEYGFDFATPRDCAQTWDARRYWLRIVAHRCQHVLKEWLYLVHTVEEGVEAWVCTSFDLVSGHC
jgi:hypothetical protein